MNRFIWKIPKGWQDAGFNANPENNPEGMT